MHGFVQQAQGHAIRAVANAATRMAFGEKPKNVLKSIGVNYVIDVASGTLANEIGDWRKLNIDQGLLSDYVTHKLLHGVLGATTRGAATKMMGGTDAEVKDAALGGAIGGMVAEIVGESLRKQTQERHAERFLSESEGKSDAEKVALWNVIKDEEHNKVRAYAELSSTITAHAFGADDAAARSAARNAIDNNWVMLVYAPEAISVCAGLYRAYRVYKTAQAAIKVANAVSDLIDGEKEEEEASQPSGSSGGSSGDGPQPPEDPEERQDSEKKDSEELLSRFHKNAKDLPGTGKYNIRTLRKWAESKGWVKKNVQEGPEVWGVSQRDGSFSWRLKIKPEASNRPGLQETSNHPRFDCRLDDKGTYYNPFTGAAGGKEVGTHIKLSN